MSLRFFSRLFVCLGGVMGLVLTLLPTNPVSAACPSFPYTVPAGNTGELINAINCANDSSSNEVINLTTGSTYTLTSINTRKTGLPPIRTSVTAGTLTINGNGATITRSAAIETLEFRIFLVAVGGNLTLNRVNLTNGRITDFSSDGFSGGAIWVQGGTLTVIDSTLSGNRAGSGGGIRNDSGSVTLLRSTLSANVSNGGGGGLLGSDLRIFNSTISGNTAVTNGGIEAYANSLIVNSTIVNNTATGSGGGGFSVEVLPVTIRNSIVASNFAPSGNPNCKLPEPPREFTYTASNNISSDSTCDFGSGNSNAYIRLGSLANNGGFTQTHALASGSAAINAGSNALAVDQNGAALTTDQRGTGFPRIVGGTVDMGAFESALSFACPTFPYTVAPGNILDLVYAINCANNTTANDTINLTASTYTLSSIIQDGTGLPTIPATTTGGTLTINGNGATITRSSAGGTPNFRLFNASNGAVLTLNKMLLSNGTSDTGGAILTNGLLTLTEVIMRANSSSSAGGALAVGSGTVWITNSELSSNFSNVGGAIAHGGGDLWLISSTVSSNVASVGGGVAAYNAGVAARVINSTIVNNFAGTASVSGLWLNAPGGSLTIQNSIVALNNGANNCAISAGSLIDNGSNIDNGITCAFGGTYGQNTNPLLGTFANNGGFSNSYVPLAGSPAISNGNSARAVNQFGAALTTDQRGAGFPRFFHTRVDIGAVESASRQIVCPPSPYTVPAGDADYLIAMITCSNQTAGSEVINLTAGSTYTLNEVIEGVIVVGGDSRTGLPIVTGTVTINGNGATVTRNAAGGTPDFRLLTINDTANVTINALTLSNGRVSTVFATQGSGGGILNRGTLTMTDSTLSGNIAFDGGAIYNGEQTLTLIRSTLSGNEALRAGGGITSNGSLNFINSTFSSNIADEGSFYADYGGNHVFSEFADSVKIINTTLYSPDLADGPNLWIDGGAVTIQNTIMQGYPVGMCYFPDVTFTDGGGNYENQITGVTFPDGIPFNSATCRFSNTLGLNTTAMLAPLANNGGFTRTHAPLPGSPVLNAGVNVKAVDQNGVALNSDQRGTGSVRIANGTVDIGAYEAQFESMTVTLALQGRSPAPHPSRVVSVLAQIGSGTPFYTQQFTTDTNGRFTMPNVPAGLYLFTFKGSHTLARQSLIAVNAGVSNSFTTPVLLEGDANNDNIINVSDFSILASAFGKAQGQPGYSAQADFNGDGLISVTDFSLLATNFNRLGDG